MPVSEQTVRVIRDQVTLLKFLEQELGWQLPPNPTLDEVTFEWSADELRLSESAKQKLASGSVKQIRPMRDDQPWGIFLVEFSDGHVYRTALRQVLRGLVPKRRRDSNLPSWKHDNLLFICTTSDQEFTFAHFRGEKPERAKLVRFSWSPDEPIRTLCEFNLKALEMPEPDLMGIPPRKWLEQWSKAFDVKPVTDTFFEEMKKVYAEIQNHISGIRGERKASFAQLLINRLLFLKFLEKKGWLFVKENDTFDERKTYLRRQREKLGEQNQWQYFFFHLFFRGLNRQSVPGRRELTPAIHDLIGYVPFLNGGLFEQSKEWKDQDVKVDNKVFDEIFGRLLDCYNFTIQENTPLDVEVALNLDLLGYAYEELIAERHGQGAFYTHPTEVGLMCRESLKTYLQEHTSVAHLAIAQLIDEWNVQGLSEEEAFQIYKLLLTIKILDPAVGSGAYPVRMMQELVNIYKALADRMTEGHLRYIFENKLANPHSIFDLKLSIIQSNLYGVDIDYFAVEIAKLRFWLSLVVDFDREVSTPAELDQIPALPNLDFKLRVGDSLVATPGRVKVKRAGKTEVVLLNLDKHFSQRRNLDAFFYTKTGELRQLKETFFNFEELRKKETKYLAISKDDLRNQIAKMEGDIAKDIGFPIEGNVEECKHILWQIHFAEIFSDERFGFDICIANPPYLRQEKLNEIFERFGLDITKDDLVNTYEALYSHQELDIDKRSDLYVYFYLRGINLLKEKGVLCFICSNSWLDVGYGARLQEFLLRNTRVKAIFDNSAQRSFEKADVNTTINLFVKDSSVEGRRKVEGVRKQEVTVEAENIVRFVTFRKPFKTAAASETLRAIESATTITSADDFRVYPIKQKELWSAGVESDSESTSTEYTGDKWGGKYLRAPDIFFTILEKGKDKLVRLGDIAEVRRGFTTGANEFFYLDEEKIAEWGIEREFLKPVIKSPRECKSILIDPKQLKYKIFMCHKEKKELKGTKALKYIEWGEKDDEWTDPRTGEPYPPYKRPSCKGRERWWDLGKREKPTLFVNKGPWERHFLPISNSEVFCDQQIYEVELNEKKTEPEIQATANSTISALFFELNGRSNFGEGILWIAVYEAANIFVIFPRNLTQKEKLLKLFGPLSKREIGTVYQECGLDREKPIRSQQPNPLPDRKALDDVVFDALGLTEAERKEVYWAVCELVQNRLMKARSV